MATVQSVLQHVQQVKTFIESAEAALTSAGDDSAKIEAARTVIESADEAMRTLLDTLDD